MFIYKISINNTILLHIYSKQLLYRPVTQTLAPMTNLSPPSVESASDYKEARHRWKWLRVGYNHVSDIGSILSDLKFAPSISFGKRKGYSPSFHGLRYLVSLFHTKIHGGQGLKTRRGGLASPAAPPWLGLTNNNEKKVFTETRFCLAGSQKKKAKFLWKAIKVCRITNGKIS